MYSKFHKLLWFFNGCFLIMFFSCKRTAEPFYTVSVTNDLDISRSNESIEIWLDQLDIQFKKVEEYKVLDKHGKVVLSQTVDINSDSIGDYLLFQTHIDAKESKTFTLKRVQNPDVKIDYSNYTYSRFVPERMDDFAWENDKVAFRTYGPECQRLYEAGDASGLISSGIDCWLKRVDYPIIDAWYANYQKGISYHEDRGEGLDNYHVGTTRGCGGTSLICEGKSILSENFASWKIIANGPIRTIFELNYEPIDACENKVSEKKTISIDLGSHFYHCDVSYTSNIALKAASAGITLHKGAGTIKFDKKEGWISYWEPLDDSFLGTAVLLDPKSALNYDLDTSIHEDERLNNINIYSVLTNNGFSYWAGFGWKKQGDFTDYDDWTKHLKETSLKMNNPLKIEIIKE
ncbi:DUF4861 family protein [Seonamhaeicola sp.]|uniref:DUF4861 family protein n=1 Tax=Seonamhaeicola sp. TaxID=1912245 RepID=UPI002638F961|nr:DUF4861 family protein [Seonamhaeicola sp.]